MILTQLRDPPELADMIAKAIALHEAMTAEERDEAAAVQRAATVRMARLHGFDDGTQTP